MSSPLPPISKKSKRVLEIERKRRERLRKEKEEEELKRLKRLKIEEEQLKKKKERTQKLPPIKKEQRKKGRFSLTEKERKEIVEKDKEDRRESKRVKKENKRLQREKEQKERDIRSVTIKQKEKEKTKTIVKQRDSALVRRAKRNSLALSSAMRELSALAGKVKTQSKSSSFGILRRIQSNNFIHSTPNSKNAKNVRDSLVLQQATGDGLCRGVFDDRVLEKAVLDFDSLARVSIQNERIEGILTHTLIEFRNVRYRKIVFLCASRGIGNIMMQEFNRKYPNVEMRLDSVDSAINFWTRQGFTAGIRSGDTTIMIKSI